MGKSVVWVCLLLASPACSVRQAPDDELALRAPASAPAHTQATPDDVPAALAEVGGAAAIVSADAGSTPPSPDSVAPANPVPDSPDAAAPTEPAVPADLSHSFQTLTIAPGEERTGLCQSWTLGNAEPLYVNRVVSTNLGGFHHSNWIWVDEASYPGPDGTWPCADRGFEQVLGAAVGGVFFAQSTQSLKDTQAFPEGVAFEIPAHATIIGDVHLLNPSEAATTSSLSFDIYTLPAAEVRVRLQPMAFTNTALDIAAGGDTTARMECAVPQPDFDIYYVLPHYHSNGRQLRVDVSGGPMDGANVFTSEGAYGEALGRTFAPPLAVAGALGLTITCDFRNLGPNVLSYGVGEQEMCVVLIYSTGLKAGGLALSPLSTSDVGGVHSTDALCVSVGAP